jgi:hypothetical protein
MSVHETGTKDMSRLMGKQTGNKTEANHPEIEKERETEKRKERQR